MGAVATSISVSIVGIVIVAILVGAVNGSVFWVRRNGLLIGSVVSVTMLLFLTAFIAGYSSIGVTLWSLPSLLLAFLASYMIAGKVRANRNFNAIWCSLIAFLITLVASVPYILTFRLGMFVPIVIAVVASTIIVIPAIGLLNKSLGVNR